MKLKKILAAVAASAVAILAMAINAFAAITNENGDGRYAIDLFAEGYDPASVYGFSAKLSGAYASESGCNGGLVFNSDKGWDQHEWGTAAEGKEITVTDDGVITLLKSESLAGVTWAQCVVVQFWGEDITVESLTVLDKDGNALTPNAAAPAAEEAAPAAAEEDKAEADETADITDEDAADEAAPAADTTEEAAPAAEEAAPAETTAPAADTAATTAAATGNVAVASIAAVMAVAGVAVIASRKRK